MTEESILLNLERIFDRQLSIETLVSLRDLMNVASREKSVPDELPSIALGLDANAFLKISNSRKFEDIMDYLSSIHEAPIVLPGQVIQEFWNNQYVALHSTTASIKSKLDSLSTEMDKIDTRFGSFAERVKGLVDEMNEDYGYLRDPALMTKISGLCEFLVSKASPAYVPRIRFHSIAAQRKMTKTPPGFKDEGDGDFYVWADFLFGLARQRAAGARFQRCVLITDDKKIDWSLGGMAHPVLVAEARVAVEASFEVWSMKTLEHKVVEYLAEGRGANKLAVV